MRCGMDAVRGRAAAASLQPSQPHPLSATPLLRCCPPSCPPALRRDPKQAGPEALAYLQAYLQSVQDALDAPDWLT